MKLIDDGKRSKKSQKVVQKLPIPEMPDGYYSGDKPNMNLPKFIEEHLIDHSYDQNEDDYNIPAFDKAIDTTKATAIYNMHAYWSKKPHDAIRQYIRHYSKPGDLVLDPFCGSGGTALAALMEGRAAIAIDRSPAATFITKNYCTPVDVKELQVAFEELKAKVKSEVDWLYETKCDRCGGKATTAYTIYSQVFQCQRCSAKIPLFDCVEVEGVTAAGKPKKVSVCPHCYNKGIIEEINTRTKKFGSIPVLISYFCENGCKPKRGERRHNDTDPKKLEYFKDYDIRKIKEIEDTEIPYWVPPHKMMNVEDDSVPWGDEWREGRNFRKITDLYTKRNLYCFAIIFSCLRNLSVNKEIKDSILFAIESILLINSRMCRAETTQTQNGTYYLPQIFKELKPINSVQSKINLILESQNEKEIQSSKLIISTEDSRNLNKIQSNTIDYIFTDPPYTNIVQYGELNFIWEAWLDFDTKWHHEEIIVNSTRGKTIDDWASMMHQVMNECYRVLKPGRWITLCYHGSEIAWAIIQDIMAEVGFISDAADSSIYIDTGQKSYNQIVADKVNQRDLVINFRKPKPGEISAFILITGEEDKQTFSGKIRAVIRDYLTDNPGSTKDRIYDDLISRMVRSGTMEAHNFDQFLQEVAESSPNESPQRWYLKSEEIDVIDEAESEKEDHAAQKIRAFIASYLIETPESEGVHYSNLFEYYLYAVPQSEKPRRQLADWLGDYFYKTQEGTWRLPATDDEETVRAEGRKKGIARRIRHYLNILEKGLTIRNGPDNRQLVEWIHHCRRAGMYSEGRRLFETGGLRMEALPEELQVEVEEDYETCVRMGARQLQEKPKRARKKKI